MRPLVIAFILVAVAAEAQTLTPYAQLPGYTHLVTGRVGPPRPVLDIVLYRADTGQFVMVLPDHPRYRAQVRGALTWADCVDRTGLWPAGLDEIVYAGNVGDADSGEFIPRWWLFDRDTGQVWTYEITTPGACDVAVVSPRE